MEQEFWKIGIHGKRGVGSRTFLTQHIQHMFIGMLDRANLIKLEFKEAPGTIYCYIKKS